MHIAFVKSAYCLKLRHNYFFQVSQKAAPLLAAAFNVAPWAPPIPISPMITVGNPMTITPPWTVLSPMRAAIKLLIWTVGEPLAIISGGPTHTALSVTRAAGSPPMVTLVEHGPAIGPPTWGTTPVTMGQVCMSVNRAAGGIVIPFSNVSAYLKSLFILNINRWICGFGIFFICLLHLDVVFILRIFSTVVACSKSCPIFIFQS